MSFLNFQKSAVQSQAKLNISESKNFENVTVISRNGPFEGSAEERNLICLLSDGRLLIVQGKN